ncbi:MAG TPA: hypothetical protein VFT49_03990 [Candidatus Saccharimonadales bacterium]|nr:hypothetical protein [Candidatus Saccharimonadales bacterium]
MKPANFLRYVLLPIAALAAGVKLGFKYSQDHYVVRDKKFIEGKVVNKDRID